MLISDIINDGIGLLSKQLRFYCWHYKRDLDTKQQQELLNLLNEHYFERLASKIKSLIHSNIDDSRQQIGKLLFEHCLSGHRRNQLIQLIKSDLVDINVRLDNYGRTLLHRTAYNLDVELVKLLIDHGVNIRLRDYAGNTALHIAIQSYRNGALIYNNEPDVVQNLTSIIELMLEADKNLQIESAVSKRVKLNVQDVPNDKIDTTNSNQGLSNGRTMSLDERVPDIHFQRQKSIIFHQKPNLVSSNVSPPKDTICRIIGSKCACRNQMQAQQSNNQTNESSNENDTNSLESQQLKISSSRKRQASIQSECLSKAYSPMLMDEDPTTPLVDTKNAFGRTALHYCVLVVGEQHLDHFVSLLINHGADVDVTDTRMKTPLYCLVKRPGVSAVRQKCIAITKLIEHGCDDLGLGLGSPRSFFTESVIKGLESNITESLSKLADDQVEPIFVKKGFKRVVTLKHLARLSMIKINDVENGRLRRQTGFWLPQGTPHGLNLYVNRRVLDQSELF